LDAGGPLFGGVDDYPDNEARMAKNPTKKSSFERLKEAASSVGLPSSELVIPPAPKKSPIDNWQIVVAGHIDPRQIFPTWLQLIGCIDENECSIGKASLQMAAFPKPSLGFSGPALAGFVQFDVGPFAVTVVPDKWIIQTVTEKYCSRLVDVTAAVFTKLNEIYVSAFGINKNWTVVLKSIAAGKFLADKLAASGLPWPVGNAEGQVIYKATTGDLETNISIGPSELDKDWLNISYNRHHAIVGHAGYYDVGKMIREQAENDWSSAVQYGAELTASIPRVESN